MVAAGASCERIRSTPIPFSYSLLLHRTAYLYCFLLPFGLVDSLGFMTPFVVAIVAYTFFGLDALATRSRNRSAKMPTIYRCRPCAAPSKSACANPCRTRTCHSPCKLTIFC